jgi:hypothetical protein
MARPKIEPVADYLIRTTVKITADKNGRERAVYWSRLAGRWLPITVAKAQAALAAQQVAA